MQLTLQTEPSIEPISLRLVKQQINVSVTDDDLYIKHLITVARSHVEDVTNRALVSQVWNLYLDRFPLNQYVKIMVPKPPMISVAHIKYTDNDGTLQTWDASKYVVDVDGDVGQIYPAYGEAWPVARDFFKAVVIQFEAGYVDSGAAADDKADRIPKPLKHAMLMLISHWYENRENTIVGTTVTTTPKAFDSLIAPYRMNQI